jgi:hypothetical protein
MIEVNTSGTMGDAFIIILKLIHKGTKQINHHSVHDNIFTKIKEMYSLLVDEKDIIIIENFNYKYDG